MVSQRALQQAPMLYTYIRTCVYPMRSPTSCHHSTTACLPAMDSFGKAFKAGLAKAYAAGQQQVQNKVSKLLTQDKSNDYKPLDYSAYGWQYGAGTHPGQVRRGGAQRHDVLGPAMLMSRIAATALRTC